MAISLVLLTFSTALFFDGLRLLLSLLQQILSLLGRSDHILVVLLLHGVPGVEDDGVGDDGDGDGRVPVDRDRQEDVAEEKGRGGLAVPVLSFYSPLLRVPGLRVS